MTIQLIPLEQINENTYNPRSRYEPEKIKELASSIEQNGLLEPPKARLAAKDTYEMAYGGYRLRAFKLLSKKDPEKWGKMPIDVVEISDTAMVIFALEENLKRANMRPMETANAIAKYFEIFPTTREEDLAVKLSMTQATISNMRRVTRLPKEVLKYIDDETLTFTQGRELCTLSDLESLTKGKTESKLLMIDAIALIGTEGIPSTVAGMKKAIHKVVHSQFLSLDPGASTNVAEFNTTECAKCARLIKTTDDAGKPSLHCSDPDCWNLKQQAATRQAAVRLNEEAEAKKKADAEAAEQKFKAEATADKVIPPLKYKTIEVASNRLEAGGDIFESYKSLQDTVIGVDMSVPPAIEGTDFYISSGDFAEIPGTKQAYKLVKRSEFKGEIRVLKPNEGESQEDFRARIRKDPNGPLHGVVARWQKDEYVLTGPPVVFAPKVEPVPEKARPVPQAKTKKEETTDETPKPVAETKDKRPAAAPVPDVATAAPQVSTEEEPGPSPDGIGTYSVTLTRSVKIADAGLDEDKAESLAIDTFLEMVKHGSISRDSFEVEKES